MTSLTRRTRRRRATRIESNLFTAEIAKHAEERTAKNKEFGFSALSACSAVN